MMKMRYVLAALCILLGMSMVMFNYRPSKSLGNDLKSPGLKINNEYADIIEKLGCSSVKSNPVCGIIKEFNLGSEAPQTPMDGMRVVNIGYIVSDSGKIIKRLIVFGYSWTRDFHQKIYFPNNICAIYVIATKPDEPPILEKAIQGLENGVVPKENEAYEWAMKYEWEYRDCSELQKEGDGKTLSSKDGIWRLRFFNGYYIFIARDWNDGEGTLFFKSRAQ